MLAGPDEHVRVDVRRHSVVLARPLALALGLSVAGALCFASAWPLPLAGALALALGALVALRAVCRWERTRVLVTTERVFVVEGMLRRRATGIPLRAVEALGLEQSLAGRLLGYGTIVAGGLELPYVPDVRQVYSIVERFTAGGT